MDYNPGLCPLAGGEGTQEATRSQDPFYPFCGEKTDSLISLQSRNRLDTTHALKSILEQKN